MANIYRSMGSLSYGVSKAASKSFVFINRLFSLHESPNERPAIQLAKLLAGRLHPYVVPRWKENNKKLTPIEE